MTLTVTDYKYIELDDNNVPIISGTTMKVIELVEAKICYGWSPEEIHLNHRYLSLSQIYSALAYYWDHQEALDADIERRFQCAERLRQEKSDETLKLIRLNEYAILAEEGLRDVYENEPDGLWEQCLES